MRNLARQYLEEHGQTTKDWDGICGELADCVVKEYRASGGTDIAMIWVEGLPLWWRQWAFHMVPYIGGLIHDAWCDGPALSLRAWLRKMFGAGEVTLAINGDDFWTGDVDKFRKCDEPPSQREADREMSQQPVETLPLFATA